LIGEDSGRKLVIRVSDPSLCRKTIELTDEEYENDWMEAVIICPDLIKERKDLSYKVKLTAVKADPRVIQWIENPSLRERRKTLSFHFENLITQHKHFSESKRLLYVACTRAKRELVILRAQAHGDELKLDDKSWSKAFDVFISNSSLRPEELRVNLSGTVLKQSQGGRPFFHTNNLGMVERLIDPLKKWGVTPEVSVTKLNALLECPRQFYYKSILKLDLEEKPLWGEESEEAADELRKNW
jgi:hypothetical protein